MKKATDDFIMLPTVDFCFKELMRNDKVRLGFIAALSRLDPKEIKSTELLPTELQRESRDDKLGILDVRVKLFNGIQFNLEMQVKYFEYWDERVLYYLGKMFTDQLKYGDSYEHLKKCLHVSILDFKHFEDERCYRTMYFCDKDTGEIYTDKLEIQFLELKKIPQEIQTGDDLIAWMKFLGGKSKEEFAVMAEKNEYIKEAYKELQHLSEDEQKRIEYEARDKALKDYNTQIRSAERRGEAVTRRVFKLFMAGHTEEEIARECELKVEKVHKLLE